MEINNAGEASNNSGPQFSRKRKSKIWKSDDGFSIISDHFNSAHALFKIELKQTTSFRIYFRAKFRTAFDLPPFFGDNEGRLTRTSDRKLFKFQIESQQKIIKN